MTTSVLRVVSLCIVLALLGACAATVPVARKADDEAAKSFSVPGDKAGIYIVRQNSYKGKAILFQIALDGKLLGGIAAGTYFYALVEPGNHTVTSLSNENQSSVTVTAQPGSLHFVQTQVRFGMTSARVELEEIPFETGKALVNEGSLAAGLGASK